MTQNNATDTKNLLREFLNHGMINIDTLQSQLNTMKQEILENHKERMWTGTSQSKGKTYEYWYTYLPDLHCKRGKRLIKRSTKEKLEEAIIQFYLADESKQQKPTTVKQEKSKDTNTTHKKTGYSFKTAFENWIEFKKLLVSDNTIVKYKADYRRFFEGTAFEVTDVNKLTSEVILSFLATTVKKKKLTYKALSALCSYIHNTLISAKTHKCLIDNPWDTVQMQLPLVKKLCKDSYNLPKDRTLSPEEIRALSEQLHICHTKKPTFITPYAIDLAFLTGMRVGELCALRWSDIEDGVLVVRSSEKMHRPENKPKYRTVETTKTGKERKIPITQAIDKLLKQVGRASLGYNRDKEFIFVNKDGRINTTSISSLLIRLCKRAGIERKSIHDIRRTVNSQLRMAGANVFMAASLMGHSERVNQNHYTYDISQLEQKKQLLELVNDVMHSK